ncbi:hypothetical protein V6N13_092340 [Hibiscus sabdariffa]
MESDKFALLFVAMVAVLLAATAPTITAARNEVKSFSIIANAHIRNPFANIFFIDADNPAENCSPAYTVCFRDGACCSGKCVTVHLPYATISVCQ